VRTERRDKILLAILPYWSPIVPPVGLAALKSFLQPRGYKIKAVDIIAKKESLEFYYEYFDVLAKCIPAEKRRTFYNIGHDLLEKHMMAHLNYTDEKEYIELVKLLIYHHFYVNVQTQYVVVLNQVLDQYYERLRRYFLFLLKYEKPDVVGITVYKTTLPASLFVLKLAKEIYPHIRTVIGGGIFADSHAPGSPNFERLLQATSQYIDKIFIGQGELLFLKYLRGELPSSQRVYTQQNLKSEPLSFEDTDIPDFSDFNIYKYSHLAATASIGCMFKCSFCNEKTFWGKFRKKDTRLVVDEMIKLHQQHNRQLFFMTDSLLNPVIEELANEMTRSKVPLYYDAYFRIDEASTKIKNTMLWRRGGLYRVRLGIESGSQRMLDKMNKKINLDQVKAALSGLAFAGIKTTTYWLIGHPGETEEDFQKTLALVKELKDCIWQAECNPFRYYYNTQNCSDAWSQYRVPLYTGPAENMLVFQEWTLNLEPRREVVYERVARFINHCKELGIPNPYSGYQYHEADNRWEKLHKNAVPPMQKFAPVGAYVDENQNIKFVSLAVNTRQDDMNFEF
jgi:hypothetical protein